MNEPVGAIERDDDLVQLARDLIRARSLRMSIWGKGTFSQPPWDMLLDMYVAHGEGRQVLKMHVIRAANAPVGTASRYLSELAQNSLVGVKSHSKDKRSQVVFLTRAGFERMTSYLSQLQSLFSNRSCSLEAKPEPVPWSSK